MAKVTVKKVGLMPHVALLRGINVGGKNLVPMAALTEMFVKAGCEGVRTYIQSGNVVFAAAAGDAAKLPGLISKRIEKRLGLRVPVVLRTAAELRRVVNGNPFAGSEDVLHVAFLADEPTKAQVAALDPERSPGDSFLVRGREVYMHCPNGMARTKLTNAYFDSKLGTVSTARNWRTVLKLVEMVGEVG